MEEIIRLSVVSRLNPAGAVLKLGRDISLSLNAVSGYSVVRMRVWCRCFCANSHLI